MKRITFCLVFCSVLACSRNQPPIPDTDFDEVIKLGGKVTGDGSDDVEIRIRQARLNAELLKQLRSNSHRIVSLDCGKTAFKDDDVVCIEKAHKLKYLYLDYTDITDRGLAKLRHLNLETIDLSETRVSDTGMAELAHIKTLRNLYLGNVRLTEKALDHFRRMEKLELLSMLGVSMPNNAIIEFWKEKRSIIIQFDP